MIGIVIVTHAGLAREFIAAVEHVMGKKQPNILPVCIAPDADMGDMLDVITHNVAQVDMGQGVVILTDMFGGTPSNLAISLTENKNIEVLAGINLPALIKLVSIRHNTPLAQAVSIARDAGIKYMTVTSDFFCNNG